MTRGRPPKEVRRTLDVWNYELDRFPTPLRPKKEWDIIVGGFGGGGATGIRLSATL